jgi:hypothetical protein
LFWGLVSKPLINVVDGKEVASKFAAEPVANPKAYEAPHPAAKIIKSMDAPGLL